MTARRKPPTPLPPLDGPFVALDFETADHGADSACAIGLARVENNKVVHREAILIRPPRERVMFTEVHGITWAMVRNASPFRDVWQNLTPLLAGAKFLAAHNAPFDRRVLHACCAAAGLESPPLSFVCSMQVARRTWAQKPVSLPAVCRRLGIGLIHHHAGSDAEACARIVIAAASSGRAEAAG